MKNSSFLELKRLVDSGNLNIINIVAIPRSMSTVLGVALSQGSKDVIFVNEPFSRLNLDLEIASADILTLMKTHLSHSANPVVIIKSMGTYISDQVFARLCEISTDVIWCVRDPLVQIESLIIRMANDLAFGFDSDVVGRDAISLYLNDVVAKLKNSEISQDFSRTGWSAIGRLFRYYKGSGGSVNVIDGTELVQNPGKILSRLCMSIGMKYSDVMANGPWDYKPGDVGSTHSRAISLRNAWTKDVAASTGFLSNKRAPMAIESLPKELQNHLTKVAQPTYEEIRTFTEND